METRAYAVPTPGAPLVPHTINRREVGPFDVAIDIKFAGICHSDIHQGLEEWGQAIFPMVPGHEIAGVIVAVGSEVTKFKVGDHAGIGCFVDSCGDCDNCNIGEEQYCLNGGNTPTYNGLERDGVTPTYGGYSTYIVCKERYVLHIPKNLPLDAAAPLLCAGITLYNPLRKWLVGPGMKVGVMGLGGLGHMGVKLAVAMGADVTMISHSKNKEEDAMSLGAHHFLYSGDEGQMKAARNSFDIVVNAVSADIDVVPYLNLLGLDGVMALVGAPPKPLAIPAFALFDQRRTIGGSMIGGIPQTQEMLDFCGTHDIVSEIETIAVDQVNDAWKRVVASDVRYRFVIDTAFL
jgi:uncharacterized zinc-type alcohol dehydrogenase-like protein